MADTRGITITSGETVPVPITLKRDNAGVALTGATITLYAIWHSEWQGEQFTPSQPTAPSVPLGAPKINGASCTADADQEGNAGLLTWTPGTDDTDVPGVYFYQVKVVFSGGAVQMFPRVPGDDGYILRIAPSLASLAG